MIVLAFVQQDQTKGRNSAARAPHCMRLFAGHFRGGGRKLRRLPRLPLLAQCAAADGRAGTLGAMDTFDHLMAGLAAALSLQNLAFALIGCVPGTLIGVLPLQRRR